MSGAINPTRSALFRFITVGVAAVAGFALGIWGMQWNFGRTAEYVAMDTAGVLIAGLCALSAAAAAFSFFAGVSESVNFAHREAQIDKLTGLHARAAMIGKVAEAAVCAAHSGKPVFLIDIDIDRFKQVNEAIGYTQGDQLIRGFARRIQKALPAGVEIGRLGAGEFGILIGDDQIDMPMAEFIQGLIDKLAEPYQLATRQQSINVSLGIVAVPKDGDEPVALLRRSNLALQHARATGVGNWSIFQPSMGRVADHRRWIESELNAAFERGDFRLHYQPQFDLRSGSIVGYEALIRWNHPDRGMITPGEFIPIAEETGMIGPIGTWVLQKACEDARLLPAHCFVAVNISPVQFMMRDFVGLVRQVIARTGIAPRRLELEITESAMMQDRARAAAILRELTAMGISVAVDDFGTGYSNLSYLSDFSFHKLKIDRSFVSRIESDSSTGAVVSTIVGLSRALGVDTIAEGVETEHQATLLKAAGCQVVQGYFFGRPAPLEIGAPSGTRHDAAA